MKIKFNKFEKTAGVFVGVAILSCVVAMLGIAVKNGWLSRKVPYYIELESADGVHSGTIVQIAGLRVGSVVSVDLTGSDHVLVRFEVLERFKAKIKKDSTVQMYRPFILADKVLEISPGADAQELLPAGTKIPVVAAYDVMDFLSGKKMTTVLSSFDNLADSLRVVGTAFANKERTQRLVDMLDRLNPLVNNLNQMSLEVVKVASVANKNRRAEIIIDNLAKVSTELEAALPGITKEVPDLGVQLGQIVRNLNVLTTEFQKLTPAINAIAPDLPRSSKRAVEALDEMVITLKALQKSFILRGNVNEVRDEEKRQPANTSEP